MEKEVKLFDKRFVHFMWDDELKGKTGHMSNDIKCLCDYVNNNPSAIELIEHSSDESQPFQTTDGIRFRFAYYDPNYEVKKAFNEEKKVQILLPGGVDWRDVEDEDALERYIEEGRQFRIKPERLGYARVEMKGSDCDKSKDYTLTVSKPCLVEDFLSNTPPKKNILDKPECPCEEGLDSKVCADCQYQKQACTEEPCVDCSPKHLLYTPKEKNYRPFKDCDELIEFWSNSNHMGFFQEYSKPMIWVRGKDEGSCYLITGFDNATGGWDSCVLLECVWLDMKELFEKYEFLDGKPCGVEVKE